MWSTKWSTYPIFTPKRAVWCCTTHYAVLHKIRRMWHSCEQISCLCQQRSAGRLTSLGPIFLAFKIRIFERLFEVPVRMDFDGLAWNLAHNFKLFFFILEIGIFLLNRATIERKHISRLWRSIFSQWKKISKIANTIFERNIPSVQKYYRRECTLNLSGLGGR